MENAIATISAKENAVATIYGAYHRGLTAIVKAKSINELVKIVSRETLEYEKSEQTVVCRFALIGESLRKAKQFFEIKNGKKPTKKDYETICSSVFGGLSVSTAYQYEKISDIVDKLAKKNVIVESALVRQLAKESVKTLDSIWDDLGSKFVTLSDFLKWKKMTKNVVEESEQNETETENNKTDTENNETEEKNGEVIEMDLVDLVAFINENRPIAISMLFENGTTKIVDVIYQETEETEETE